MHLGFF